MAKGKSRDRSKEALWRRTVREQRQSGLTIREFCRRFPRLHLERFPAYAPELNPDGGVWNQMDNVLANGRPDNLDELAAALNKALRGLRVSQPKLRWCVHQTELPPFLA